MFFKNKLLSLYLLLLFCFSSYSQVSQCGDYISGFSNYEYNGNNYYISDSNSYNWNDANDLAQSYGFYLLTINSEEESDFIQNTLSDMLYDVHHGLFWTGLVQNCNTVECEPNQGWSWITGEPLNFENWLEDPDDDQGSGWDDDVAWMTWNGEFNDSDPTYNSLYTSLSGQDENLDIFMIMECGSLFSVGCTNPEAENYNPEATEDDGSCIMTVNMSESVLSEGLESYNIYVHPYDQSESITYAGWWSTSALGSLDPYTSNGQQNSNAILSTNAVINPVNLCDQLEAFGYDDWYLPSRSELEQIYYDWSDLGFNSSGYSFTYNDFYWSSSWYNIYEAAAIGFFTGNISSWQAEILESNRCRCVRTDAVFGCNDETALNYDVNSDTNDGSCIPTIEGCIDENAFNYNAEANTDDGSCIIYGCTYEMFFEYNPLATDLDDSCQTLIISGCTNPDAENYNLEANVEDNSCIIYACTNPDAENYNLEATNDDDSCIIFGCTNLNAENYNLEANVEDNSCVIYGCLISFFPNYNPLATNDDGSCDMSSSDIYGCTDSQYVEYNPVANIDNGSCVNCEAQGIEGFTYQGIFEGNHYYTSDNMLSWNEADELSSSFGGYLASISSMEENNFIYSFFGDNHMWIGFTDSSEEGNWIWTDGSETTFTNWNNTQPDNAWLGQHHAIMLKFDGTWDDYDAIEPLYFVMEITPCLEGEFVLEEDIYGCTDLSACNYNMEATTENGSCIFVFGSCESCDGGDQDGTGFVVFNDIDGDGVCDSDEIDGCMDSIACNYFSSATDDDGSCVYADSYYDCDSMCINDIDGDGVCDELELPGCLDVNALNYNPDATDSDDSCEFCELVIVSNITGNLCANSEATIDILVNNGSGNYSYQWSNGVQTASNSNISNGLYDLTVYDINTGCSVSESFNIIAENLELSTSIDYNLGECAIVTVDVLGGTSPYTYETSNSLQEGNNIIVDMCAGEQLIMVTDANGCTESITIDIMQIPDWDINVSTDANHTILIPDDANLTFENSPLSIGSYIGVFYTNQYQELVCAGSAIWEGETTSIAAWGSEAGLDNGFEEGENFIWGMWDSNTGQVQYGNAEYIFNPSAFTGQGNYMPNGLSGIASITTPAPIWNYDITDANHVIALANLEIYIDDEALEYGDWMGVFYTDDDGNLACGGMTMWTGENIAMMAWGDDSYTIEKDGFSVDEEFIWKIWNYSDGDEFQTNATYHTEIYNEALATNPYVMNGWMTMPQTAYYAINGMSAVASFYTYLISLIMRPQYLK